MRRKIYYVKDAYITLFILVIMSYLDFKIAFSLFDLISAAQSGLWDEFFIHSKTLIIFAILLLPANIIYAYTRGRLIKSSMTKMKTDYMKKVFNKNISEFQADNNALYISAITNDFNTIEKNYIEPILDILEAIIRFATAILIISIISPLIILIGLVMVVVNVIISALSSRPVNKHNKERSVMMSSFGGFIKEVLSAFHIIKTNNLETTVTNTYNKEAKKVQGKKFIIDRIMSYIYAIQNSSTQFLFYGLVILISYLMIDGVILFAGLIVVLTKIGDIINPVTQLSQLIPKILSVKSLFIRIDETLENRNNKEETISYSGFNKSIEFKEVGFSYDDKVVLHSINMNFEKGKKYLVIGPSGGGKSTMLRLLRKYFDPLEGEILIDGQNLSDIKKMDYFSRIANVEQQTFLFEDTFLNNLALYKDYSDDEIWDAINRAGLHDFIATHEDGLNRMILDNGKNISGGERSRVAIARALLNKVDIIFLDEAFASLDRKLTVEIEKSILALKDITIINVSHVIIDENKNKYDEVVLIHNNSATLMMPEFN
ncbi:ABC transporter ATP-binding protein [Mycoplasmatota bacterium WC30]